MSLASTPVPTAAEMAALALDLRPTAGGDFEALASLRIEAMRESLQRVGRFDPTRARGRLLESFSPQHTRQVFMAGARVGFFTVRASESGTRLEHLYIHPEAQGRGIGSLALRLVMHEAAAAGQILTLGALRESASNRFYVRHGFVQVSETESDIEYAWSAPVGLTPN